MALPESEFALGVGTPPVLSPPENPAPSTFPVISTSPEESSPAAPVTFPDRPLTPERTEVLKLSKSIIRITAGYDTQLRQTSSGKEPIVDLYAYRPRRHEIDPNVSREEAINHFEAHARKIDQIGLNRLPPEWEYIRDSQQALAVYLREQDKLARGEPKTPYAEYLMSIDGYQPNLIPWIELDGNWDKVIDILDEMGEKFNTGSVESVRAIIRKRSRDTLLESTQDIERLFWRMDKRNRRHLTRILGTDIGNIKFDFRWEETDAFWRFFEVMDPDGEAYLRANWHERHRNSYDNGWVEMYAGHEPVHFFFGGLIGKQIREGRLDPAAGLLVIPGPAGFQMEGLAQTIGDIVGTEVSQDGELAVELYRMEKRALVNGLYLVEQEMAVEMAALRIRKYMPRFTLEGIRKILKEGMERPFERAFLPNYGMSDYSILKLKERIGVQAFVKHWFSRPQTHRQFLNPILQDLIPFEEEID